jgi:hypothetical protein
MKFLYVIGAIGLTILSWGLYGSVIHQGQHDMPYELPGGGNVRAMLLPFFFVGVAYFLIAVAIPALILSSRGEAGHWSVSGIFWGLLAGATGAIGALGIILAFESGGRPVYVMPIVFGGAPIVNSLITTVMNKLTKKIGPVFIAGLMMVILGAITVLVCKPSSPQTGELSAGIPLHLFWVIGAIVVTVGCWGAYGPFLHKGQMKMAGSRLRPLLCVGMAYFGIAVAVPTVLLSAGTDGGWSSFTLSGTFWSLAAGAAGVFGSLGIIMAFNWGGKPIYVMPLVFGGAPVVNTLVAMLKQNHMEPLSPFFWAGLILVIAGAVLVLVFAPKGHLTKTDEPKSPQPVEGKMG